MPNFDMNGNPFYNAGMLTNAYPLGWGGDGYGYGHGGSNGGNGAAGAVTVATDGTGLTGSGGAGGSAMSSHTHSIAPPAHTHYVGETYEFPHFPPHVHQLPTITPPELSDADMAAVLEFIASLGTVEAARQLAPATHVPVPAGGRAIDLSGL